MGAAVTPGWRRPGRLPGDCCSNTRTVLCLRAGGAMRGSTLAAQLMAAHCPAFLFGGAAPDADVLAGDQGELQALVLHRAARAHCLSLGELAEAWPAHADRKE